MIYFGSYPPAGDNYVVPNRRPKQMTPEQAEKYQEKAVRGLENLGLDDDASAVEELTPAGYAEQKGIEIVEPNTKLARFRNQNQKRRAAVMATKRDLLERINELESENEELQDQIDQVMDILAPAESEEDEGDQASDGEDDDQD